MLTKTGPTNGSVARRGPAHAVTTLGIALKSFGKYVLSYIPNMVSEVETMPF